MRSKKFQDLVDEHGEDELHVGVDGTEFLYFHEGGREYIAYEDGDVGETPRGVESRLKPTRKRRMTTLKSIKIRTPPEGEWEAAFWAWARTWWTIKIDAVPDRIRQERRVIAWLSQRTGVQYHSLRRLLKILKLDPGKPRK
jgi:hypothetical protein